MKIEHFFFSQIQNNSNMIPEGIKHSGTLFYSSSKLKDQITAKRTCEPGNYFSNYVGLDVPLKSDRANQTDKHPTTP